MQRDNDIVKALGFVALYAAYLEESVDVVMERLSVVKEITNKEKKIPTSQKIDWCNIVLSSLKSNELDNLISLLNNAKDLLEKRNEVIHGRIYVGNDRSDDLKSGRDGVADREVTADELYDLAEEFFKAQATIPNINYFATIRAVEQAMLDPTSVFACPVDVCDEQSLTRDQKIKILRSWEYDARELEVAEEENMGGGPPGDLDKVLMALHSLDADVDIEHSPPTKQGGE